MATHEIQISICGPNTGTHGITLSANTVLRASDPFAQDLDRGDRGFKFGLVIALRQDEVLGAETSS